jgi:predicted enzyme related to lactoylglutathione lyase
MEPHHARQAVSVQDADMTASSFVNTRLAKSRFDDVDLQSATFTNVNLAGIVCVDANLAGASIANANLTGMTVNGIPIEDMLRAYRQREAHGGKQAAAVLYATDMARLSRFYQDVLGFTAQNAASDHVVLVSPAYQLALVKTPSSIASSIEVKTPPRSRIESSIKLAFATTNIAAVRASAPKYGGAVLPQAAEWDFDGARLCDGSDPEGNVFQLREAHVGHAATASE